MTRTIAKVDKNQRRVVRELRELGFSVYLTHQLGKGFPDFLVVGENVLGYPEIILVELKSKGGTLTPDEKEWHSEFPAPEFLLIAYDTEDILEAFGRG